MTYRFAGFFAGPSVPTPEELPDDAVWREISAPFVGVGLRLGSLVGKTPDAATVTALAHRFGFNRAERWIYLTYDCWGGLLDSVYGMGMKDDVPFGPRECSEDDLVEDEYVSLMRAFGLEKSDALYFAPFVRGFWGKT